MKILYTSALIDYKYDLRKSDYIKSYNKLIDLGIDKSDIIIVESVKETSDYLNEFGSQVFISNTHNSNIRNKGVSEVMCLKKYLESPNISDEELICKLTGRYSFIDNYYFELIKNNSEFNFYGKLIDNNIQIFAGCFSMRKGLFVKFLNEIDLDKMERETINLELEILNFLNRYSIKSFYVDKINMIAPIFGTGEIQTINV